jgi:CSLREA domain-containing protein
MKRIPSFLCAFLILALILIVLPVDPGAGESQLSQVVFAVTKTVDTDDGMCDSDCSLREAIIAANMAAGESLILLPPGIYTLSIPGIDEDAAATGDLDITSNVTLRGSGAALTIIDGGQIDRVFHITDSTAVVTIEKVTVQNGGGFYGMIFGAGIANYGTLTLRSVTVKNNLANGGGAQGIVAGGGVANNKSLSIFDSTISANTALGGANGGGGLYNSYEGAMSLLNTTVSGNTTTAAGGGIFSMGSLSINSSTISGNSSSDSAGLWVLRETDVFSTIIAGNSPGPNCKTYAGYTITSLGRNLDSGSTCAFTAPGDLNNNDPRLGPLQNNGGQTYTHALQPGSPALNAAGTAGCPSKDQRGFSRPQGPACDIGAFEAAAAAPQLQLDFTGGAPGSFFTLTGSAFPPESHAVLTINGHIFPEPVLTSPAGEFLLLLDTSQAGPGYYMLTVWVGESASAIFHLEDGLPLHPQDGDGPVFPLPGGIAYAPPLYLPLVVR